MSTSARSSRGSNTQVQTKIDVLSQENSPLLVSDGPVLPDYNLGSVSAGGKQDKRPPPDLNFYFCTSWVLFLEGLSGISGLAVSYFYKNTLKVDPAMLTTVSSLTNLPWTCKPIYGFISDAFPIGGYRRKPYLFIAGVMGFASWVAMSLLVNGVWSGFTCMLIGSTAIAIANVISEAIVVERSKGEPQEFASHLQSVVWGAASIGGLIASFLSGYLLKFMTDRQVFLLVSVLPLSLIMLAFITPDRRVTDRAAAELERGQMKNKVQQLYRTVMLPEIFYPTAFIFALNATPSTGSAWFYFYSSKPPLGLGFTAEFLGTINVVGSVFNLAGVVFFQAFLKKVAFRPILIWGTVVSTALGLSNLILVFHWNRAYGIPDWFFCLGESAIQSVVGWVATMPIIVMASRLCPDGMEGTMYALIMSVNNLGGIVGSQVGAVLCTYLGVSATNLDNFWLLVFISNASSILPLLLIGWVPAGDPGLGDKIEEEDEERS
jgi:folate/biopterin transporter